MGEKKSKLYVESSPLITKLLKEKMFHVEHLKQMSAGVALYFVCAQGNW